MPDNESLPSLGAWIETDLNGQSGRCLRWGDGRSLHWERGLKQITRNDNLSINVAPFIGSAWIEIGNCIHRRVATVAPSLGAWIENLDRPVCHWIVQSLPSLGAWIENI